MKASWDIFCSVVDNYGDIGVTWRLARQLVAEHQQGVRLWVDDLRAFVPLCPEADAGAARQWQQGVEVCQWPAQWSATEVADVVVEAFACKLPEGYLQAMKAREKPALWINLEYLSAEDWVSGCHGLPSMRPDGLKRMFFFQGLPRIPAGCCVRQTCCSAATPLSRTRRPNRHFCRGWGSMRTAMRG